MGLSELRLLTFATVLIFIDGIAARTEPGISAGDPKAAMAPAPGQDKGTSLLFVQPFRAGRLVIDNPKTQTGTLTLYGVSNFTIWFTDTPVREAGQMNTSTFMGPRLNDPNGQWLSDPNAALYISNSASGSGKDAVVIITLTNPVFNNVTNVATYKAAIVPGNSTMLNSPPPSASPSLLKSYTLKMRDPAAPTLVNTLANGTLTFESAVLFIDCWWWGGGGWGWGGWGGWGWGWGR